MLKAKQRDNWCTKLHNFVPRFYSSKKFSVLRWPFCSWHSSFEVQFLGDHLQWMIIMTLIKENKDLKIISHCYWDIQKVYKLLLWVCCRNPPSWEFCSDMCVLLWCIWNCEAIIVLAKRFSFVYLSCMSSKRPLYGSWASSSPPPPSLSISILLIIIFVCTICVCSIIACSIIQRRANSKAATDWEPDKPDMHLLFWMKPQQCKHRWKGNSEVQRTWQVH